jgi:hypothetical protein
VIHLLELVISHNWLAHGQNPRIMDGYLASMGRSLWQYLIILLLLDGYVWKIEYSAESGQIQDWLNNWSNGNLSECSLEKRGRKEVASWSYTGVVLPTCTFWKAFSATLKSWIVTKIVCPYVFEWLQFPPWQTYRNRVIGFLVRCWCHGTFKDTYPSTRRMIVYSFLSSKRHVWIPNCHCTDQILDNIL